ncbi:uncharacterized protein LOC118751541 [Rhagoletis pomonella]|uniref:uncharacterized protein LOC118751541 n=1 Tax=Rhagoletis pomonella TaxID=28610 RepID=UPI001786C717|nr:uncharacterized protein LOC118751541 [Rhagoletis pomonella]
MARWLLVNSSILAGIWLCATLLLQARHGDTAPTHHLTVSVEGNTPTLIVTSAEIGITPRTLHASTSTTAAAKATTAKVEAAASAITERRNIDELGSKGNVPKLKGKSYKLHYGKKWQHAAKEREKGKVRVLKTQVASMSSTEAPIAGSTTVLPSRLVETITTSTDIPILTTHTTNPTTVESEQHFEQSTEVATTVTANIAKSSEGALPSESVIVTNAPSLVGSHRNALNGDDNDNDDEVSTPGAIVSAATGNLPRSTEAATAVTLAPTNAAVSRITAGSPIEKSGAAAELKSFRGSGTEVDDKRAAEELTATTAFMELHDTTAASTTKEISIPAPRTAAPNTTAATTSALAVTTKPISATTANAPMIAIQIETLPKAITATIKATEQITTAAATATSALPTNNTKHQTAKTMPTTTIEFPIADEVAGVSQSTSTVPTSYNGNSVTVSAIMEMSSVIVGDNLPQTPIPPARNTTAAIRLPKMNVSTATTSVDMLQEATTSISTTTKKPEHPSVGTTKSVQTIQTTAEVSTDSGIIFIDDVSDNREAKRNESEGELQNDEANIGRHGDVKDTSRGTDANNSGTSDSDGIIKLIDLEKHDLKSISKAKKLRNGSKSGDVDAADDDDGHDGVKKTRKKQLTDKHYLLVPDLSVSEEFHVENMTAPGTIKTSLVDTVDDLKSANKATENGNNGGSDVLTKTMPNIGVKNISTSSTPAPTSASAPHQRANIENSTAATPTLRPVHNGYLGPILMEEMRFTVKHANLKPQQHHESTIESQLRDGRIVEILAPTALVEQTTAAPAMTLNRAVKSDPISATTSTPAPVSTTFVHVPSEKSTPMFSTTVFQVPETLISTTRLPLSTKTTHGGEEKTSKLSQHKQKQQQSRAFSSTPKRLGDERTESKISDIQVEVYDSTVDSIVSSTNFKDSDGFYALPLEAEADAHGGTTKPPAAPQERFTQYVVDRADYATQESSVAPHLSVAFGKPEPAAIEIHINVSEGIGNESEDLEFSYRQPDYTGSSSRTNPIDELMAKTAKAISMKPLSSGSNDSAARENVQRGDEILVVEIIDTGDNSTEGAVSAENANPIFTFRSDSDSDIELKDIKYFPPEVKVKPPQMSDELFLADLKRENALPKPPLPPPPPPRKPTIDRDSDTIFYISNTEVKVGESLPTANTDYEQQQQQQQLRKTRLENQFFPANYLASTRPNAASMDERLSLSPQQHHYEEDIILSPLRNTADSLKIFRNQGDEAPPLDVTYIAESVVEVEQSSGAGPTTTFSAAAAPSLTPDVIIQPAILPEMSIGVPVIGELPPQIELKEIDFMPDEANQPHSGMYENNMLEENGNGNGNDVDRLVESSVQYGGDLIDESAGGGGFDGVEGSYPFGNPAALHNNKAHHAADYAHFTVNHGISNLRKDELSADVAGSGEMLAAGQTAAAMLNAMENGELKELLARSGNDTYPLSMLANASYAGASTERMSNATAYSVLEEPNAIELVFKNHNTLVLGVFIVLLPVVLTVSLTCAMWYLYGKFYGSPNIRDANQANGSVTNDKKNGDGENSQEESNIDTATSIPKQHLPSVTENVTNGSCLKAMTNSHSGECNITKPSSYPTNNILCNGVSGAATVFSVDERALLSSETSVATPSLTSIASPLNLDNNNKLKIQANLSNNSVQENFTRPNGSVTKMTLKNNHLIVETEERHDISRVARETTMHYNTSDKDGVFVVEVARGVDSKSIPNSPTTEELRPIYETPPPAAAAAATSFRSDDEKILRNHDEIQIHQPPAETLHHQLPSYAEEMPERSLHQIVELEEPAISPHSFRDEKKVNLVRNSNTGLSQSDLSSTSSAGSNKRYSYGNQELYTIETTSYASPSTSANLPLLPSNSHNAADDDDRRSENGHSLEHSPATQGNSSTATANDSAAHNELCKHEQGNEQIIKEKDINSSQQSESDPQQGNVATEIELFNEEVSTKQECEVAIINEVKETENVQTNVVTEKEPQDVETKDPVETVQNEIESVFANVQISTESVEHIDNNNSPECVDKKPELPVPNGTDDNKECVEELSDHSDAVDTTVLHISSLTEQQIISEDNLISGDNESPPTFPQTIVGNYGYDSIISLPDPPSTEEIKQLGDFAGIESSQLDSLPPPSPPPPPILTDLNDNNTNSMEEKTPTTNASTTEAESTTTQLKLKELLHNNLADSTATNQLTNGNGNGHDATNGNIAENATAEFDLNGYELHNGHAAAEQLLAEHLELSPVAAHNAEGGAPTGRVPQTPLTPPESPPLSSPVHYTNSVGAINGMNGVNRGICGGPMPVAVDVNGS